MEKYDATFEIDSKTDSYAARRILERVYDTVREESWSVREDTDDATELLGEFETLRDAVKQPKPGRLTITYEQPTASSTAEVAFVDPEGRTFERGRQTHPQ